MLKDGKLEDLVYLVLLLFKFNFYGLYALEWIVYVVMFFISVAEEGVSERFFREGQTKLIDSVVDIVAPFGPPGGTDQKFAITKAAKIGRVHERIVPVCETQLLSPLHRSVDRVLEVVKHQLFHNFLLLATA